MLTIFRASLTQTGQLLLVIVLFACRAAQAAPSGVCTLYAAPDGAPHNSGATPNQPVSLRAAADRSKPGSVICLLAGTYFVNTPFAIRNSGRQDEWIVYQSLDGRARIEPRSGSYALWQLRGPTQYVEIRELIFDGHDTASAGVDCAGCDHLRVIRNKISNTGRGGVLTYPDRQTGKHPDYITVDHNMIYRGGYNQGGSSAISYNHHGWFDQYPGFHSFVTNNIISGEYDNSSDHTDGNGIIMDNPQSQPTPPTLIANNVVYENGGRCIHSLNAANNWIVNNTCYANGLDLAVKGGRLGNNGEFALFHSSNDYLINNLAYAWRDRRPFSDEGPTPARYFSNIWYTPGTGVNVVPASVARQSSKLRQADPHFVSPPAVGPTAPGQYRHPLRPDELRNEFHVKPGSPAIGAGIDPTTLPNIPAEIISGLRQHIYSDIENNPRPKGGPFDIGAYQSK